MGTNADNFCLPFSFAYVFYDSIGIAKYALSKHRAYFFASRRQVKIRLHNVAATMTPTALLEQVIYIWPSVIYIYNTIIASIIIAILAFFVINTCMSSSISKHVSIVSTSFGQSSASSFSDSAMETFCPFSFCVYIL